jgi:cytochrome c oxidase cbb3-type subunit I
MNLYLLMAALFVALAALFAADAALIHFNLLPWFSGVRWLRIHLITLGAMTEALFGLLPAVVALRAGRPRPEFRWDTWLTLNIGILTLLAGIPIMNQALILTGGTFVFIATLLLAYQLRGMPALKQGDSPGALGGWSGRPFYIAGLVYLLVGIIVGTGLWLGWGTWLRIKVPLEVHIHANNWGFMSLVFAGLLVDLYATWAKRNLAWPRSINAIFWMMTVGALGLVLGPWVQSNWFAVPGLLLHLTATIWLLLNVAKPLLGDRQVWSQPGIWHLLTAYVWILAPVLVAPLIILNVPGFPGAGIEANAPQALIYGWVLQFGFAILPFFFRRAFLPDETAQLGGSWLSLIAVHLGGVLLWSGIFLTDVQGLLHGTAYVLWVFAMLPMVLDIWRIVRDGLARQEMLTPAVSLDATTGD